MSQHDEQYRQQFAELVDAHGGVLLGMLRRLARNTHDADEVFQDTAMRVWKNIHQLHRVRNRRAWLMTIGYRAFLDFHQRRSDDASYAEQCDDRALLPHEVAEQRELARLAQEALAELPEPVRRVAVLHYSGGLSLRETASMMELPVGTIKSRLNQALKILRRTLS